MDSLKHYLIFASRNLYNKLRTYFYNWELCNFVNFLTPIITIKKRKMDI